MNSYHVFFTAKKGVNTEDFEASIRLFLEHEMKDNLMRSYRVLCFHNTGNFPELTRYQAICDYDSESDQQAAFANMRPDRYKQEPHLSLMNMVEEMKVAFSSDTFGSIIS